MFSRRTSHIMAFVVIMLTTMFQPLHSSPAQAQGDCVTFAETGRTLCGRFRQYWQTHGGLAQQGFPLSPTMTETSMVDGRVYIVQYFERAIFEHHPENPVPNDVLLSLLGALRYRERYGDGGAPNQVPSLAVDSRLFSQTGKRLGGRFLAYWNSHGGLAQQGYPISDEFDEVSDIDGNTYRVQYFERAVFEYHPNEAVTSQVLLSLLGSIRFSRNYTSSSSFPVASPPPAVAGQGTQPSTSPSAPPAANQPPSDPQAFADYIASNFNRLGGRTIGFKSVSGQRTSDLIAITLDVDLPTWHYIAEEASGTRGREWGKLVQAEARKAWPSGNYVILLDATGYTFDPCWRCEGDCYYVDDEVDLELGWYYAFHFVTILRTARAGEVINICNFANP